jgi:uncharacterized protein
MLSLRPNCECCDRDLPPESTEARICSFECTFCAACADEVFKGVCPNCGGNFVARPIRPREKLPEYPPDPRRKRRDGPCTGQLGTKRTNSIAAVMSANDPKQTLPTAW